MSQYAHCNEASPISYLEASLQGHVGRWSVKRPFCLAFHLSGTSKHVLLDHDKEVLIATWWFEPTAPKIQFGASLLRASWACTRGRTSCCTMEFCMRKVVCYRASTSGLSYFLSLRTCSDIQPSCIRMAFHLCGFSYELSCCHDLWSCWCMPGYSCGTSKHLGLAFS